jgi:hypothetical protein
LLDAFSVDAALASAAAFAATARAMQESIFWMHPR